MVCSTLELKWMQIKHKLLGHGITLDLGNDGDLK